MDEVSRQQRIEAGKKMLEKFKKKKRKRKCPNEDTGTSSDSLSVTTSVSPGNSVYGNNDHDILEQQLIEDETSSNLLVDSGSDIHPEPEKSEEGLQQLDVDDIDLAMSAEDIMNLLADLSLDQNGSDVQVLTGQNAECVPANDVGNVGMVLPYVNEIDELKKSNSHLRGIIYQLCVKLESVYKEENPGGSAELEALVSVVEDMNQQIQKVSSSLLCNKDEKMMSRSAQTSLSSELEPECLNCQINQDCAFHALLKICLKQLDDTPGSEGSWGDEKLDNLLLQCAEEQHFPPAIRTLFLHIHAVLEERNRLRLKLVEPQGSSFEGGANAVTEPHISVDNALKKLFCLNFIAKMLETSLMAPKRVKVASHEHSQNQTNTTNDLSPPTITGSSNHIQDEASQSHPADIKDSSCSMSLGTVSDINNSLEMNVSCDSIEKFRSRDVSNSMLNLKEFLQDEAMVCCAQLDASFDKKNIQEMLILEGSMDSVLNTKDKELPSTERSIPLDMASFKSSSDMKVTYNFYAQQKFSIEQSLKRLTKLEKCESDAEGGSQLGLESYNILSEEIPINFSVVSLNENDDKTEVSTILGSKNFDNELSNKSCVPNEQRYLEGGDHDADVGPRECRACSLHQREIEELQSAHEEELRTVKASVESSFSELVSDLKKKITELEKQITFMETYKMNTDQMHRETLQDLQSKEQLWSEEREQYLNQIKKLEDDLEVSKKDIVLHMEQNVELEKQFAILEVKFESQLETMRSSLKEMYVNENLKLAKQVEDLQLCKDNLESVLKNVQSTDDAEIRNLKEELELKCNEQKELLLKVKHLENDLKLAKENLKLIEEKLMKTDDEKVAIECQLQNQIADLVQEYEQELKALEENLQKSFKEQEKNLSEEKDKEIGDLKKANCEIVDKVKAEMQLSFEDEKQKLKQCWNDTVSALEARHSSELSSYQKKVENLLEEKCLLITKSKEDLEKIIKKNHHIMKELYDHIQSKINEEMEKFEANQTTDMSFDSSTVMETFSCLGKKIQKSVDAFFEQKYSNDEDPVFRNEALGSHAVSAQIKDSIEAVNVTEVQNLKNRITQLTEKYECDIKALKDQHEKEIEICRLNLEDNAIAARLQELFKAELEKMKEEFIKEIMMHKEENERLAVRLQVVTNNLSLLEECNVKLKAELEEVKLKEETPEEAQINVPVRTTAPVSSSKEIQSWQVHAAQTNSRLLHVLCDLVKTFVDIERDINSRLMEYGLIGNHSEMLTMHDDDTGQSIGSREDCNTLSVGDGQNLELTEDGPDLTPRAWDLFASVGTYDAEIEGEDVVIGASRRLRAAVDQVLNFLAMALDKQKDHDFKLLLKRNEELSHELQGESEDKDNLQMDLMNAESLLRKFQGEKKKLEDEVAHVNEEKDLLSYELSSLKAKITRLEDEKDIMHEENKQLREHCSLLASRLGDPEKTGLHVVPPCTEKLSHEMPELLQENTALSSEKMVIQKRLNKERQTLLSRVQQLELSIEEITAEKDDIIEKLRSEVEDLKSQIEAMDKQLQSNKKFIDEQVIEREQEREEYLREVRKISEMFREKEKIQQIESQLAKEAETLEQQLKSKIEDHRIAVARKEELEGELRQALDKIHDLREIIVELEKQLEMKTRTETDLKQKLVSLSRSLSVHEQSNADLKNQLEECSYKEVIDDSIDKVRDLQEQLTAKTQEVEQLAQSENFLQELRGQIHFLEAKVDQKVKQLEAMNLVTLVSPVMSDDASHSDSHDGIGEHHLQFLVCNDGWEMSPRSVHWLEIRRLEEKIVRLLYIEEELVKRNKELTAQLKSLKTAEDEHLQEKEALQQKVTSQLLQISSLKSDIDEHRHRVLPPMNIQSMIDELERLREKQQLDEEYKKHTSKEISYLQEQLQISKMEAEERAQLISCLQKDLHSLRSEKSVFSSGPQLESSDDMRKELEFLRQEKAGISQQLGLFKTRIEELETLLGAAKKELENERVQVEMLIEEINQLSNKQSGDETQGSVSSTIESVMKVHELMKENEELTSQLREQKFKVERAESEQSLFIARIKDLEDALSRAEDQIEEQVAREKCKESTHESETSLTVDVAAVSKLKHENRELKCLLDQAKQDIAKYEAEILVNIARIQELEQRYQASQEDLENEQNQLERDFNTVQEMMQRKETELSSLQEETENQLRLESEIDSLHKCLEQKKVAEQQLYNRIRSLEKFIDDEKLAHASTIKEWEQKVDELSLVVADLKKQMMVLKSDLFLSDEFEDVDLEEVEERITKAAEGLKDSQGDNKLFRQIVYRILKQAVDVRVSHLQKTHDAHVEKIHKSWQEKLEEERNSMKSASKQEFEKEMVNMKTKHKEEIKLVASKLKKKYEESIKKLAESKDKFWQAKIDQLESLLKGDQDSTREDSVADNHQKGDVSRMEDEMRGRLEECYQREMNELRKEIEGLVAEKKTDQEKYSESYKIREEELKNEHEKEKIVLLKECERKLEEVAEHLRNEFVKQKEEMEAQYDRKICELQDECEILKMMQRQEERNMHGIFTSLWEKKIENLHKQFEEDVTRIKNSKNSNIEAVLQHMLSKFESKLKEIQSMCESYISTTRSEDLTRHKSEMQKLHNALEEKFEEEKNKLIQEKITEAKKELIDFYEKEIAESIRACEIGNEERNKAVLDEHKKQWEEEAKNLRANLEGELNLLKKTYQVQLQEKELQLKNYENQLRKVEERYNLELGSAKEIIEALKITSSKQTESQSRSTKTSSSDVNSADENCSSCVGDLYPSNFLALAEKVKKETAEVAALSEKQVAKLLLEQQSIMELLEDVVQIDVGQDFKSLVKQVVDELKAARSEIELFLQQNGSYKQKIAKLQKELDFRTADFAVQLDQHKKNQAELEAVVSSQRKEISRLYHSWKSASQHSIQSALRIKDNLDNHAYSEKGDCARNTPLAAVEKPRSGAIGFSNFSASSPHLPSGADIYGCSLYGMNSTEGAGNKDVKEASENHLSLDSLIEEISFRHSSSSQQPLGVPDWLQWKSSSPCNIKVPLPMDSPSRSDNMSDGQDRTLKHSLVKVTSKNPKHYGGDTENNALKIQRLYWKYRRSHSHRRSLIYQKNYLLKVLSGFQATEELTLAILSKIGVSVSKTLNTSWASNMTDERPNGCSLFRSAAFVVIAIHRMQLLAIKWQKASSGNSLKLIERDLKYRTKDLPAVLRNSDCKRAWAMAVEESDSSSSISLEGVMGHRQASTVEEKECDQDSLHQYVQRLNELHEQLGLSDLDRT